MTNKVFVSTALLLSLACAASAQVMVIVDPTVKSKSSKLTSAEDEIFRREALPPVQKTISTDVCEEQIDVAGVIRGSFSRPDARESLIFYQYCQTGNGFGQVGLVLIEGDHVTGNFIADAGWSIDIAKVADVNRNGIDEFALSYSGGMHQGQGGVGIDLMEFSNKNPLGLGWFKSEEFTPDDDVFGWKVTAKPGIKPIYYRQKYRSVSDDRWRRIGANSVFKLGKVYSKFERVN